MHVCGTAIPVNPMEATKRGHLRNSVHWLIWLLAVMGNSTANAIDQRQKLTSTGSIRPLKARPTMKLPAHKNGAARRPACAERASILIGWEGTTAAAGFEIWVPGFGDATAAHP